MEESSESADETIESSEAEETEETETSSGVISAPQDRPGSSETTASDHISARTGIFYKWTRYISAPTAAETNAALEAPGQNSGNGAEEVGPGV